MTTQDTEMSEVLDALNTICDSNDSDWMLKHLPETSCPICGMIVKSTSDVCDGCGYDRGGGV